MVPADRPKPTSVREHSGRETRRFSEGHGADLSGPGSSVGNRDSGFALTHENQLRDLTFCFTCRHGDTRKPYLKFQLNKSVARFDQNLDPCAGLFDRSRRTRVCKYRLHVSGRLKRCKRRPNDESVRNRAAVERFDNSSQQHAGEESADVRPPRYSSKARRAWIAQRTDPA